MGIDFTCCGRMAIFLCATDHLHNLVGRTLLFAWTIPLRLSGGLEDCAPLHPLSDRSVRPTSTTLPFSRPSLQRSKRRCFPCADLFRTRTSRPHPARATCLARLCPIATFESPDFRWHPRFCQYRGKGRLLK